MIFQNLPSNLNTVQKFWPRKKSWYQDGRTTQNNEILMIIFYFYLSTAWNLPRHPKMKWGLTNLLYYDGLTWWHQAYHCLICQQQQLKLRLQQDCHCWFYHFHSVGWWIGPALPALHTAQPAKGGKIINWWIKVFLISHRKNVSWKKYFASK